MKNKLLMTAVTVLFVTSANAQVDTTTSDKKLLEGKDKQEMYEVAKPSSRLYMRVEGMDVPVRIKFEEQGVLLLTEAKFIEDKELLIAAFNEATGNTNKVRVVITS
ncbi:hypothetical protein [Glaciecola sp. 1036]|uniref:hypothetical protein n=1 Tax=Alteromonadaceae TaxID=72275 RepID=UPI003CFC4879